MFFGNSRISFIKNLVSLIGNATDNNYVITFIDESVSDYSNSQGTSIGQYWQEDYENFLVTMQGKNSNSYVVFDIETQGGVSDYIWAENSATSLPFSSDNIVNIFRPNSGTQQEFYETVLSNLESRWGNSIWQHLVDNDLKLLIVVDVSGSMNTSLIQGALNIFQGFLNEKGVQSYILDGCQNERWLAWGSAAYHDGENAGCTQSCLYGKRCNYICTDESSDCYGAELSVCIPPFVYSNGSVIENNCQPYCSTGPSGAGQIILPSLTDPPEYVGEVICNDFDNGPNSVCAQHLCILLEDSWCVGCSFGNNTWCDACVPCKEGNYQHKCVKCHYLSADQDNQNPPSFSYGISFCGIASCSVTSGTYFGMTSWNGDAETWSWINAIHAVETRTTLWGRNCHTDFQDASGNCGVCPAQINGDILWEIEVCDKGCSNCAQGLTAYFPQGVLGFVWTPEYNVCNLGCTS